MSQSPPTQYGIALLLGLIAAALVYVFLYHGTDETPVEQTAPSAADPTDAGSNGAPTDH